MSEQSTLQPTAQPSTAARAFKIIALAEALSWLGLLIGMFFKWVLETTEVGVKIFGPIHGTIFILYVLATLWTARVHRWSVGQVVLGLGSSIPPFMTWWFERRAERTGLLHT